MQLNRCFNIEDLRRLARRRLPKPIFDFLEGGADDEWTVHRNVSSFEDFPLIPNTLVDVDSIDTSTHLLGRKIDWPVIAAPTGASALFHYTAESAVARAVAESGTFYAMSTMSNQSLEAIGALSNAPKIFQVYVFRDRGLTEALVERCQAAQFDALCLTVDTPLSGNRERDRVNGMCIPPKWTVKSMLHFAAKPTWSFNSCFRSNFDLANFSGAAQASTKPGQSALEYVNSQFDKTLTWDDAAWLANKWQGPFALKGIMSAMDARRAVDIGATTIWLSNHGGRQFDGIPSTIECLAEIRAAVPDDIELIIDGGVRRGTHILKALAMGANACAIGRPYLYGLAAGGFSGVAHALKILRSELERDMALLGTPTVADIGRHCLAKHAEL